MSRVPENFYDGLARVRRGKRYYFVDHQEKIAFNRWFTDAEDFSCGLAAVERGGLWGFINTVGEMVIPPVFDYIEMNFYPENDGSSAWVGAGDYKYQCWIDREGYILIEMTETPSPDFDKFKEQFNKRVAKYHKKPTTNGY